MKIRNALRAVGIAASNCASPTFLGHMAHSDFTWRWRSRKRSVVQLSLPDLVSAHITSSILLGPQCRGDSKIEDLLALATLVSRVRPMRLFEFGTFRGQATCTLLANAPPDARIFTLDLAPADRKMIDAAEWDKQVSDSCIGELFRNRESSDRITQLFCDSRMLDTAPFKRSIDFIFIDGCHDREFVENDSRKALEMVRPGGVIAWHDYSPAFPAVVEYLEDLAATQTVYCVEGSEIAFLKVDAAATERATHLIPAKVPLFSEPGRSRSALA